MIELIEVSDPEPERAPALAFDHILNTLTTSGWGSTIGIPDEKLVQQLCARARELETFRQAAVGRDRSRQVNRFIRGDEISWIDGQHPAEQGWLEFCESLRVVLNRQLLLNLSHFESHFAHYPNGGFYRRHLDAFIGGPSRIISIVLYLNPNWSSVDGGELVIYDQAECELGRVLPTMGTFAVFESERFPHEVLRVNSDRYSIAGWYRGRSALPVQSVAEMPGR